MKYTITLFGLILFAFSFSGIYDYSVPKIEGGTEQLSSCQGKKIMVIVLPAVQTASADSMLYSLDTLATAHYTELRVLAVPSYEDGYINSQKQQLTQWYRSKLSAQVVISDGLYTHRASGAQQHPLFKWLTTESLNESMDTEVTGPGFKFFVSDSGELNAVLLPHLRVSSIAVQKALGL